MSNDSGTTPASDAGAAIVAALLVIFGAAAVWDTYSYFDFDSAVFPRTVAAVLILLALGVLVRWLFQRAGYVSVSPAEVAENGGSWPRRIALVIVMLAAALAMPWLGFLITAIISFGVLLVIAMHDPWTPGRIVVYPIVGLAIVVGFYFLFAKLLMVPLPAGRWFV